VEKEKIVPSDWSKINSVRVVSESELPTLADCPWPDENSHCSPWMIWMDATKVAYPIWGEYGGDPSRKRFYAQTSFLDTGRMKRLVFMIEKRVSTPSEPLWIGLMGTDTLNEPEKMWDPSRWPWAGYLEDLPNTHEKYYICVDLNKGFWTTNPIFLFFCTDAPSDTWWPVGYTTQSNLAPLNRYSLNEPGKPDGWEEMDDYYHLMFMPYTNEPGAIIEPDTSIESPVFPSTAQEGTPYEFSFIQENHTAFPCGCPSTLSYDIIDRDSGDPIGDKITHTLDCGYGGINWGGSITFTGGGTFHGRLRAGHYAGGAWPVDDTYDFNVVIDGDIDCSDYTTPMSCAAVGCYWCDGVCQSTPCNGDITLTEAHTCDGPEQCDGHTSSSQCENDPDCDWYSDRCGPRTDYGWWFPKKSTFEIDELLYIYFQLNADDLYGVNYSWKWYHNDVMVWENSRTISEHWTGFSQCLWWFASSLGQGTGYIEIYADGAYLGKTNDYTIIGPDIIGKIDFNNSTFYNGPFNPGQTIVKLMDCRVKNTGTQQGMIYCRLYEYPNTTNQNLIMSRNFSLNPGQELTWDAFTGDSGVPPIPNDPGGTWPLGVKVWGEGEDEPSWGTMKTKQFNVRNFK